MGVSWERVVGGVALVGCLAGGGVALGAPPAAGGGDSEIDAFVLEQLEAQGIVGMAVGVVMAEGPVYVGGYGYADRAGRRPVDPEVTRFRWASVSKTLMGVLAGVLWDGGILDPYAPIQAYYPAYILPESYLPEGVGTPLVLEALPEGAYISTAMLLGHTAGVQHYSNGMAKPTPPMPQRNSPEVNTGVEWALDRWTWGPLVAIPGSRYGYSTMGTNLAGVVLGAAYGSAQDPSMAPDEALLALLNDAIVAPSGAWGLAPDYHWDPLEERAEGYIALDPQLTIPDMDTDISWKLPGGGVASTVEDMAAYCHALMGNALLSDAAKDMIWTKQTLNNGNRTNYGMGFGIGSRGGNQRVSHSGEQEGTTSRLVLYPEDELCIVILTNTQGSGILHGISLSPVANGVEDILRERLEAGEAPIQLAVGGDGR